MVASAVISGAAANKASKAGQGAANSQIAEAMRQFDITREDTAPYREIGQSALFRLSDLLGLDRSAPVRPTEAQFTNNVESSGGYSGASIARGFNGFGFGKKKKQNTYVFDRAGYDAAMSKYNSDIEAYNNRKTGGALLENTPGYQFRLSTGRTALDRLMSAGDVTGGRRIKEALRYNQDFASNEFGAEADRLFRASGIGGSGVNAATTAGNAATNQINQAYNNRANAVATGASGINSAIQGGINNMMTWNTYNDMMNRYPSGGYSGASAGFVGGMS